LYIQFLSNNPIRKSQTLWEYLMCQISTKNMIHEDKISAQVVKKNTILNRGNFKTSPFAQYQRQAQILILEILNVFLWLKFSPSLILIKI